MGEIDWRDILVSAHAERRVEVWAADMLFVDVESPEEFRYDVLEIYDDNSFRADFVRKVPDEAKGFFEGIDSGEAQNYQVNRVYNTEKVHNWSDVDYDVVLSSEADVDMFDKLFHDLFGSDFKISDYEVVMRDEI